MRIIFFYFYCYFFSTLVTCREAVRVYFPTVSSSSGLHKKVSSLWPVLQTHHNLHCVRTTNPVSLCDMGITFSLGIYDQMKKKNKTVLFINQGNIILL